MSGPVSDDALLDRVFGKPHSTKSWCAYDGCGNTPKVAIGIHAEVGAGKGQRRRKQETKRYCATHAVEVYAVLQNAFENPI